MRITRQPAIWRSASLIGSRRRARVVPCALCPSVSTITRCSRHRKSQRYPSMLTFTSGRGKPYFSQKGDEALLELRQRPRGAGLVNGEHRGEESGAFASVYRRRALPIEFEVLGLVEGAFERAALVHNIGEVNERPGGRRHDDPLTPHALPLQRRPVHDDTAAHPIALHGHMDQLTSILENSPQNASTEVTQGGALAA